MVYTCAGLAGQHSQTTAEFGSGRTDGAERLDANLGQHYWPRHPFTGNRNLRTKRSENGVETNPLQRSVTPG